MKIRQLPRAVADLEEIWGWVAADDPAAANRLMERLSAATLRLAKFPESGRSRPDIGPGARSIVDGRYLILYRVGPDSVDIVRVVHGARALGGLFEA